MSKIYVFDLDGTICTPTNGDYLRAEPLVERINLVNDLFSRGHTILIYTARGMGRFSNNIELANENFLQFTEKQLSDWGVKYHKLFLGKPAGDIYVDDKAQNDLDFFKQFSIN
jgi:hypothetical protein